MPVPSGAVPAASPAISVVCSTFQRSSKLPALFASLEAQTFDCDRFEFVIVNDGSGDDTAAVLERLLAGSPLRARVVSLEANRGRSGGRNAGWRASAAPIIAFTDDDCVPTPDWLEKGYAAMKEADALIVVGRTEPNPAQAHNDGAFSRTQRVTEASGKRLLHTCNIFYRREDLEAVGGFDEKFNSKGGEDTDLGWRVLDRGVPVTFAADALVWHDVSAGSFRAAMREAATWLDIPRVVAVHPGRARPLLVHRLFWKKTHELVLLVVASVALAVMVRSPLPLVGVVPWVNFRIRKWPIVPDKRGRVAYLPHALLLDLLEVSAMVRGSIRNRTFVL